MQFIVMPALIRLQETTCDWKEAVILAGNLLKENGYIEQRYIDATLKAVNELGPYIVLAPGIAVPHARPENGALKSGISVVTLATPVNFGSAENDPVDVLIGLSSSDGSSHIGLFKYICNFLAEDKNVEQLRLFRNPQTAAAFINRWKERASS